MHFAARHQRRFVAGIRVWKISLNRFACIIALVPANIEGALLLEKAHLVIIRHVEMHPPGEGHPVAGALEVLTISGYDDAGGGAAIALVISLIPYMRSSVASIAGAVHFIFITEVINFR